MTTSSPGFTTLSIAVNIASVEPHVTTMFASGSAAIASRSGFAPQVIAYWWCGPFSASRAASTMSCGGSKSGKPWARLIASCFAAMRVISRITLSGKCCTRSATLRSLIRNPDDGVPFACFAMDRPRWRGHEGGREKRVVISPSPSAPVDARPVVHPLDEDHLGFVGENREQPVITNPQLLVILPDQAGEEPLWVHS